MENKSIPENAINYLKPLPRNRADVELLGKIKKFRSLYGDDYVESIVWTQEDARGILLKLGISEEKLFHIFYLNIIELPECYRSEDIYGLSEMFEDYRNPFWGSKFKDIEEKYLQFSSIEGEYSYFYDKKNDSIYGIGWQDMEKFVNGKMRPLFNTFCEFLQWYYSNEDE